MQVKFRGTCLDGSPAIGDQRRNAYRQARVVVGRAGAVETGLDDHAGIPVSDGNSGDRSSDTNPHLLSSASFTRPVRDRIADVLLFASTGGSCEGFRMPAGRDVAGRAWGRGPKACREETRGGRARLWVYGDLVVGDGRGWRWGRI
jgi:hypothetical protein